MGIGVKSQKLCKQVRDQERSWRWYSKDAIEQKAANPKAFTIHIMSVVAAASGSIVVDMVAVRMGMANALLANNPWGNLQLFPYFPFYDLI